MTLEKLLPPNKFEKWCEKFITINHYVDTIKLFRYLTEKCNVHDDEIVEIYDQAIITRKEIYRGNGSLHHSYDGEEFFKRLRDREIALYLLPVYNKFIGKTNWKPRYE